MSRSPLWQLRLRRPPPPRHSAFADPSPGETKPSRSWTRHLAGSVLHRVRVLWARPLQTPRRWVCGAQQSLGKTLARGECGDWGPRLPHLLGAPAQGAGLRGEHGELWRRKMRDREEKRGPRTGRQTRREAAEKSTGKRDTEKGGGRARPLRELVTGPTPLPLQAAAPLPQAAQSCS